MELQADSLSRAEQKWLKGNRKSLLKVAKNLTEWKRGEPVMPRYLDTIYDTWFTGWQQDPADSQDANAMCMLIGVGLGDAIIERVPELEWKIITDNFGTDIGLFGRDAGTVVTHPTNMVAKRIESGETTWIARIVDAITPDLQSMLTGNSGGDAT
ncbi:MAG: hypothetical protein Phyf2KO_22320 [Phycisphaerales bacterium]